MHEFTIAQNIADIALQVAREQHVDQVSAVEVDVGQASGIETAALQFAWESVRKDSLLHDAELVINMVTLELRCLSCQSLYHPDAVFEPCPGCGECNNEVLSGTGMRVTALIT